MSKLFLPGDSGEENSSGILYGSRGEVLLELDETPTKKDRIFLKKAGRKALHISGRFVGVAVFAAAFGLIAAGVGWKYLENRAESSEIGQQFVDDLQTAAEGQDLEGWFYGLVADSGITLERVAEVMAENQQVSPPSEEVASPTTIVDDEMLEIFGERIQDARFRQFFTERLEDPETEPEEIAELMFGPIETRDEAG